LHFHNFHQLEYYSLWSYHYRLYLLLMNMYSL
jgi:hypothetical protein